MVNTEIPKNYTASPSSFSGTPHLTINRDVAVDLDSSNAFEGPEKLLEVWFSASSNSLPAASAPAGLKVVSPEVWKDMLELVNCKVLSVVESEHVDAYLLSESSMFVFPHKLILKTCGTTTLLSGLPRILEIAALVAGFPHVLANQTVGTGIAAKPYRVFYSRKNFLFPDRQRGPHRSWRDEVKSLDRLFLGGSAYMIGKMNGEHWYLYLTEPNTILTPPATPERRETETKLMDLPMSSSTMKLCDSYDDDQDETLELLMTDLEPENAKKFYLDHASAVAEGRYYQEAHKARIDAEKHVGDINSLSSKIVKIPNKGFLKTIDENTDVFSNTSSDPGDLMSDESDLEYPEELMTEGHALGTVVSEACGLAEVYPTSKYPDARVDAYLFTPCGFSANGVIPAPNGPEATHYFTVHVTPESNCSYASFETNVPSKQTGRETADVIEQVVNIFKPLRFSVTLFEGKKLDDEMDGNASENGNETANKIKALEKQVARKGSRLDQIRGYRRVDRIVHDLEGYELVFKYYERFDWEGGAPRLGEVGF
ncbi:MAG: spermidine resistance protein [Alectoria sarmentosa]|nr:MAG: spermidine resistance protein [Alectoria sarmentosa]